MLLSDGTLICRTTGQSGLLSDFPCTKSSNNKMTQIGCLFSVYFCHCEFQSASRRTYVTQTPWPRMFLEKLIANYPLPWNPNIHYRVHKSQSLNYSLDRLSPLHLLTNCFLHIHFNNIVTCIPTRLPCIVLASDFPIKIMYAFLNSSMHATCTQFQLLYNNIR